MQYNSLLLLPLLCYVLAVNGLISSKNSRQQLLRIDGRDAYVAHLNEIEYSTVQCISGLRLIAVETLTGAEEIDILYSRCAQDPLRLVHYSNDESLFTFGETVIASRLVIASRKALHVIDALPINCGNDTIPIHTCHRGKRKRRHHSHGRGVHAKDDERWRRRKRQTVLQEYSKGDNPHEVKENITIPAGEQVIISNGVKMRFNQGTGIDVYGSLSIEGSEEEPVIFSPLGPTRWRGIVFHSGAISGSSISHVNISGTEMGLTIEEGAEVPTMKHVVVDTGVNGMTIHTARGDGLHRITGITAYNNVESGFRVIGEVP